MYLVHIKVIKFIYTRGAVFSVESSCKVKNFKLKIADGVK